MSTSLPVLERDLRALLEATAPKTWQYHRRAFLNCMRYARRELEQFDRLYVSIDAPRTMVAPADQLTRIGNELVTVLSTSAPETWQSFSRPIRFILRAARREVLQRDRRGSRAAWRATRRAEHDADRDGPAVKKRRDLREVLPRGRGAR